jgi:hypothetical protein
MNKEIEVCQLGKPCTDGTCIYASRTMLSAQNDKCGMGVHYATLWENGTLGQT